MRVAFPLICAAFALALHAESFENLSARAAAARAANQVPQAIELYKQALESNPNWEEGWWYLGTLLYDSDQYAGAREALSHMVRLDANAAPAVGLLGLSEFQTGEYAPALKHLEQALASGKLDRTPLEAVVRYHEALLVSHDGQFEAAMQKYMWFAQSPAAPNTALLTGIGLAALRSPLLPEQIPAPQRDLYDSAGKAAFYTLSRNYEKAGAALAELQARFPESPGVHYLYGSFLLASAPDHAIAELKHELRIAPSNAAAAAMLAWALLNRGEPANALPYAKAASAALPSFSTAQYVLGRALAETGDVERGIALLARAEQLDPMNLETHLALASAYSKAGRVEDARRERARSVEMAKGVGLVQH